MSLAPHFPDGYYDDNGEWQRTKFCHVSCGAECTCMPPLGAFYSAAHDKRREGATPGSPGSVEGGGRTSGVNAPDAVHMPVETTDAAPKGAGGSMTDVRPSNEKVAHLRLLRRLLKSGDYSGVEIMQAWTALDEYADLLERTAHETRRAVEPTPPLGWMCECGIWNLVLNGPCECGRARPEKSSGKQT